MADRRSAYGTVNAGRPHDDAPLLESYSLEEKARADARKRWLIIGGVVAAVLILTIIIIVAVEAASGSSASKTWIEKFQAIPDSEHFTIHQNALANLTHVAGSSAQLTSAHYVYNTLTSYGYTCEMQNFTATLSYYR